MSELLRINEAREDDLDAVLDRFALGVIVHGEKAGLPKDPGRIRSAPVIKECFDDVLVQLFSLGLITHGAKKRSTTDRNRCCPPCCSWSWGGQAPWPFPPESLRFAAKYRRSSFGC